MAGRSGVSDLLLSFSIISGLVVLYDLSQRPKIAALAKASETSTKARLKRIEQGIAALHAKVG